MSEKLLMLKKQKLSKKAQNKNDKIKGNLQTANCNWNDQKFQIYCNMLEWVNPRSKMVRKKLSTSSKK